MNGDQGPRFLSLKDVAEELAVGEPTVKGLITTGSLPAIQIGPRGIWRVERTVLEDYIATQYAQTDKHVESGNGADTDGDESG
ncbi:helix-turn-helix transcriptional regulator [Arthrobacter castelli]|uniref:helix-turn-helix transcriptional regulator n=1 Tax=Arthrobacter castelli TaxID=271431 RepID=UPI000410DAC2|nr:helix-turn-helix domain-containing protein [Arthrobacter castelli]